MTEIWNMPPIINQNECDDMPPLLDDNQEDYDDMPALIGVNQENYNNIPALVNNQENYNDMPALIGVNQENLVNNQDMYIINYVVPQLPPVLEEKPIYINSDTYDKSEICEIIYSNETIKLIFNSTYSSQHGYEMSL